MEKKLEVKNLRISFRTDAGKVQAVRGIDFDLYKGETLAIVGESGSGKSVTNKAIIGISAVNAIIESGEIIYDGMDLLQINEDLIPNCQLTSYVTPTHTFIICSLLHAFLLAAHLFFSSYTLFLI